MKKRKMKVLQDSDNEMEIDVIIDVMILMSMSPNFHFVWNMHIIDCWNIKNLCLFGVQLKSQNGMKTKNELDSEAVVR